MSNFLASNVLSLCVGMVAASVSFAVGTGMAQFSVNTTPLTWAIFFVVCLALGYVVVSQQALFDILRVLQESEANYEREEFDECRIPSAFHPREDLENPGNDWIFESDNDDDFIL